MRELCARANCQWERSAPRLLPATVRGWARPRVRRARRSSGDRAASLAVACTLGVASARAWCPFGDGRPPRRASLPAPSVEQQADNAQRGDRQSARGNVVAPLLVEEREVRVATVATSSPRHLRPPFESDSERGDASPDSRCDGRADVTALVDCGGYSTGASMRRGRRSLLRIARAGLLGRRKRVLESVLGASVFSLGWRRGRGRPSKGNV